MTRLLPRTHLHSSHLVRTLADLDVLRPGGSATTLADKLGGWISFTDAIALSGVHNAAPKEASAVASKTGAGSRHTASIAEDFARMRSALESTITQPGAPSTGRNRISLPLPEAGMSAAEASAYTPYRRYHQAHQRHLEQSVRGVRAKVREAVAKASPPLRQLAALDAAFENVLDEREAQLLSTVPTLLEKRFKKLLKAHQESLGKLPSTDTPDLWMKPGAWLARFTQELQTVLLAELDFRLQPTVGLLEALHSENSKTP